MIGENFSIEYKDGIIISQNIRAGDYYPSDTIVKVLIAKGYQFNKTTDLFRS